MPIVDGVHAIMCVVTLGALRCDETFVTHQFLNQTGYFHDFSSPLSVTHYATMGNGPCVLAALRKNPSARRKLSKVMAVMYNDVNQMQVGDASTNEKSSALLEHAALYKQVSEQYVPVVVHHKQGCSLQCKACNVQLPTRMQFGHHKVRVM